MTARGIMLLALTSGCRLGFESGMGPPKADASLDDASIDAERSPPPGDAGLCEPVACAAAQGTCVEGACELVANSESLLRCPDGMPCRLICSGYRYCRNGASCGGATWCEVMCVGFRACQDGVDCGAAQCEVTCDGDEACGAGISLSGGTCTSHCCGLATCGGSNPCTSDQTCN